MKLIAVDPSLACTGVCVFEDGVPKRTYNIKTKVKTEDRYGTICKQFLQVLTIEKPTHFCIESQYISNKFGGDTALKVGTVKGLLEACYYSYNILKGEEYEEVIEVHPWSARKAIGIQKRLASKDGKKKIYELITEKFPTLKLGTQDEADSVAVGLAALNIIKEQAHD